MQYTRIWQRVFVIGVFVLTAVGAVYGAGGVIEINQARVKLGGVTPADTPLFPVTISQPGSYQLTGNLDVTDASARPAGTLARNTTAIDITTDNVTIDLNGFTIMGPTTCSGAPLMCNPVGTGDGIKCLQNYTRVMNGTVRGMGANGIELGLDSRVDDVLVLQNGVRGIDAAMVSGSIADRNGVDGIRAFTVVDCAASSNGAEGIRVEISAVNSRANANGLGGIVGVRGVITGCTAIGNGGDGISATTVIGSTATNNDRDGIVATTVTGSTATDNDFIGILATTVTGCTAASNTTNINAAGIAGHNICNPPNAPCP